MNYTIYIIGEIPDKNSLKCEKKFDDTQLFLEEAGFRVINPFTTFEDKSIEWDDAVRVNFRYLLSCDAVYILPCVSINNSRNAELLLAVQLNMLIIQGANLEAFYSKDEIIEV